jgi:hypothetical protein
VTSSPNGSFYSSISGSSRRRRARRRPLDRPAPLRAGRRA